MTNSPEQPRAGDRSRHNPSATRRGRRGLRIIALAILTAVVVVAVVWTALFNAAS